MSRRIPRRLTVVGILAATVATILITGPAQADQSTTAAQVTSSSSSARAAGAALSSNTAVVTFSPAQRRIAVAQLRKERAAARAASMRTHAVDIALAQVGDAYSGGADGPNAFDCSGLTQYAWKRAGVYLDHYSYDQYRSTKRVSVKSALPGDLVFYFNNGAHHVGMYVGHGKIVHASDYGVGVIVSPMLGTAWTRAHFTGVGRVI